MDEPGTEFLPQQFYLFIYLFIYYFFFFL